MYSTIIEIKKSITGDALDNLRQTAEAAFKNRAGSVKNSSTDAYRLIFSGAEDDYGCLDLGVLSLGKDKTFLKHTSSWHWIEDDPSECCDMLKILTTR